MGNQYHKNNFRLSLMTRSLIVSAGLCFALPVLAQDAYDPFAPNQVAPTEPGALPSAPEPVAQKLPPQAKPKVSQSKPLAAPKKQTQPASKTVKAPQPQKTKQQAKPAPKAPVQVKTAKDTAAPKTEEKSFWDDLTSLFDKNEEGQKAAAQKPAEPKVKPKQQANQPKAQPPKAKAAPSKSVQQQKLKPLQPNKTVQTKTVQAPRSNDPFSPHYVQPDLPTETFQAAPKANYTEPKATVKAPAPVAKPAVSPLPAPVKPVKPAPEILAKQAAETNTGLMDQITSFFSRTEDSKKTQTAEPKTNKMFREPANKVTISKPAPAEKTVVPAAKPVPKPAPKPVAKPTVVAKPATPQKQEPSFWNNVSSFFKSSEKEVAEKKVTPALKPQPKPAPQAKPAPKKQTTKAQVKKPQAAPKKQVQQAPKAVKKADPFSPQHVQPVTPAETHLTAPKAKPIPAPKAEPKKVVKTAPISKPVEKSKESSQSFFSTLFGSSETPAAKPQAKPAAKDVVKASPAKQVAPQTTKTTTATPQNSSNSVGNFLNNIFSSKPATKIEDEPFAVQSVAPTEPVAPVEVEPVKPVKAPTPAPSKVVAQHVEKKPELKLDPTTNKSIMTAQKAAEPTVEKDTGFFNKVGSFFKDTFSTEEDERTVVVEPQPKAPKAEKPEVKKAAEPKAPVIKPADARLLKAKLGLGKDIKLGQSDNQLAKSARCFTKSRGTIAYCLTPTQWPEDIAKHFDVTTHLFKGTQGIVQIEGSLTTRLFTMFDTEGFNAVVNHFEQKYGNPTTHFVRKIRTIKKGKIENPVYIWRKDNPDNGQAEILEIRKYTDIRRGLPDTQRAAIRVYFDGSREIFSLTSDLDFMDLRR